MSKGNFEKALAQLQVLSEKIKSQDTNLEDAITCYEEGMNYYHICDELLETAKQKIETFER
ncbi:exodeoxyribonuclease VII small subunit [Clostridiales Family XIII bacterium PM5-7]